MAYHRDLRDYIKLLEEKNLLWRIKSPVKRETELMPMVRWQFRGLPEEQRRAFLFENVEDLQGHKYDVPVLVGALAASREIYATGMNCRLEEIADRWAQAQKEPISARLVANGPAHEEIHTGKELSEQGLSEFPFTIDTPGFDGLQRFTATHMFSKDPETGTVNIGNYSAHIQSNDRITIGIGRRQHLMVHLEKARALGRKSLHAAVVVGVVPAIAFVSVSKVPYGHDELAVAGGLAGEPIEVIKCKTVDLDVPASSEIVVEGEVSTEHMESHTGGYGEYCGYMGEIHACPVFHVTAITHRKKPILSMIISQMPPSESSKIRQIAYEANLLRFLKFECNIPNVTQVAFHESSGSWQFLAIQLKKTHPSQAWQALNAAAYFEATIGKILIAVDEDIDPHDPDSLIWAMSFRMQPHRDTRVVIGKAGTLDPSTAPPGSPREELVYPKPSGTSALLIDATRKWVYPPVALPKREYMERAREIWEAEGLPPLRPRTPWFGYELGYWPERYAEAANLNLQGRLHELGERTWKDRVDFELRHV